MKNNCKLKSTHDERFAPSSLYNIESSSQRLPQILSTFKIQIFLIIRKSKKQQTYVALIWKIDDTLDFISVQSFVRKFPISYKVLAFY